MSPSLSQPHKIAFVYPKPMEYCHRLLMGMTRWQPVSAKRHKAQQQPVIISDFLLDRGALPARFHAWQPDGVIAFLTEQEQALVQLQYLGKPVVHTTSLPIRSNSAIVVSDSEAIFESVWSHFKDLGLSRITQILSGEAPAETVNRQRYLAYCSKHKLDCHICQYPKEPKEVFTNTVPRRIPGELRTYLNALPKPAGLFTQQIFVGAYLGRVCQQIGIKVPEEVAIIGVGDFDVSSWCKPAHTTVQQPVEAIGAKAIQTLIDMIKGKPPPKDHIRLKEASIIARGSTRPLLPAQVHVPSAIEFIETHACQGITVEQVVEHTQRVSRPTFQKYFTEWTGKSPATYIREKKLQEARRLLSETDLSVTTIAQMCGYAEDIIFRKVFRKHTHQSPTDYRKLRQKINPATHL